MRYPYYRKRMSEQFEIIISTPEYDELEEIIYWIVNGIVGELAYGKPIKGVPFAAPPS